MAVKWKLRYWFLEELIVFTEGTKKFFEKYINFKTLNLRKILKTNYELSPVRD